MATAAPTWIPPREWANATVRACLESCRRAQIRVTGDCMAPALEAGELVWLAHRDDVPPRLGDVVLIQHVSGLHLHRVVWGSRTKADRSRFLDGPGEILATVVGSERHPDARPRSGWHALASLADGVLRAAAARR
jgi:hypothetical protein